MLRGGRKGEVMKRPVEQREYQYRYGRREHGRSTIEIKCPFCATWVEAFLWSLAGCGKKCPSCGAIHTYTCQLSHKEASHE